MHPKNMSLLTRAYYIRMGLEDSFALDFLSSNSKDSIVLFLAEEMGKFYESLKDVDFEDFPRYTKWENANKPFFEKATLRHPLGAYFGETFAKAVETACNPIFADLEKGKNPEVV